MSHGWRRAAGRAAMSAVFAWLVLLCPVHALELVYVHDPACVYCRQWDRVIGPAYPNSEEAKRAPLRRVLLSEIPAEGLRLRSAIRYTPTFVLVDGVVEIGRIEGYPGEEFFWLRLEQLLEQAEPPTSPAAPPTMTRTNASQKGP